MKFKHKIYVSKKKLSKEEILQALRIKEKNIDEYVEMCLLYEKRIYVFEDTRPFTIVESLLEEGIITQEYIDNKSKELDNEYHRSQQDM